MNSPSASCSLQSSSISVSVSRGSKTLSKSNTLHLKHGQQGAESNPDQIISQHILQPAEQSRSQTIPSSQVLTSQSNKQLTGLTSTSSTIKSSLALLGDVDELLSDAEFEESNQKKEGQQLIHIAADISTRAARDDFTSSYVESGESIPVKAEPIQVFRIFIIYIIILCFFARI